MLWVPDVRWRGKKKKLEAMLGSTVVSIDRKAKYIIFTFIDQKGINFYIINHLSMSGGWLFREFTAKSSIYTRLTFEFCIDGNSQIVDFVDPRRFGRLEPYTSEEFWSVKIQEKLSSLGPDALNETISQEILNQRIHNFVELDPRWEIKPLLMDQTFISGIGNIYASEICFLAGINPFRRASDLSQEEIQNLVEAIPPIMQTAYKNGGSTISTYKSPNGKSGWTERMIYGQKCCRMCKSSVLKGPQMGRSTYWCSKCQAL